MSRLRAEAVTLGYDRTVVSVDLTVDIPAGEFTVIVGPNACGKSTLLRALCRLSAPSAGSVLLDGQQIAKLPTREVARRIGLLPQSSPIPDGITVRELVARGRSPHQGFFRQFSVEDRDAVERAMAEANVGSLAGKDVDALSGGQRQRVWLAMVLAQETETLILDEPTTYLDLAHQGELLERCQRLHRERGRTLVAVLHDLNQACRYATHLIAMRDGCVRYRGAPAEIVTADMVREVFDVEALVIPDPITETPMVVPYPASMKLPLAQHNSIS